MAEFTNSPMFYSPEDGSRSGQEYLNDVLRPAFEDALEHNASLLLDLDGLFLLASPFIRASIGGLAQEYGAQFVRKHMAFKSLKAPVRVDQVNEILNRAPQVV